MGRPVPTLRAARCSPGTKSAVAPSLGWPGPPAPQSQEAGNREAALLAERQGRREAPDGLGAPPAGCGGSRSQSGARAQTSGRQRTPATGPQGPRGGARVAGPGAGPGAGLSWPRPAGLRATWAEAPPLLRPPEALAGSGAPEAVLQERREDLGCIPGNGDECQPAVRDDEVERQPLTVVRHIHS